jgi:DivIVA domain-containing protein
VLVVEIVLAAVVLCGVAAVAMGYGGSITHFAPDWPGRPLPEDRTLRADDVTNARFSLAFRGYRMSEVDAVLDRLAFELNQRDARIEQLSGRPYESVGADETSVIGAPVVGPEAGAEPLHDPSAVPSPTDTPGLGQTAPAPVEEPIFEQTYADNPYAPPRADNPYARPRDESREQ